MCSSPALGFPDPNMFSGFYAQGSETLSRFQELDGYYVPWPGSHFANTSFLINFNYDRVMRSDPRFRGFLCMNGSEATLGRFGVLPVIDHLAFLRRKRKGENLGLLDFSTTRTERMFLKGLSAHAFSFLCGIAERKSVHTYATMAEEREHVLENAEAYAGVLESFAGDDTSRRMLLARLRSILSLDMSFINENHYDVGLEYFNPLSEEFSFVLKEREVFCDVGASFGDCVIRFADNVVDLAGSKIIAFEPNAIEYERLRSLEHFLPLKAYKSFVSDQAGSCDFVTDPGNVHGSSATQLTAGIKEQTSMVTLDQVCETATLIKLDAEGAEPAIINGARRLLENPQCRLATCVYHYPGDILKTIKLMESMGRTQFRFRQHHPSLWDGLLYFD